ncbi:hypothetical protein [Pseudaeromonas pectinilytica]
MKSLVIGFLGIVVYTFIICIGVYLSANQIADILYSFMGGVIAALLILLKDLELEQDRSRSIKNYFLAVAASLPAWIVGLLILKIFNVWVAGDSALAFDLTIGALGAVVMYLYRLHDTAPCRSYSQQSGKI